MKLSLMLATISSVLMVAQLSFAKTCDPIVSTSSIDELEPDQLKGNGEWRMQSMRFYMKIGFEAESSIESHPRYKQIRDILNNFGGSAIVKADLSALTSKPLAKIEQGFNAQNFVTVECLSGVENTELQNANINGEQGLPYSINRSSLGANLEGFMTFKSRNKQFPAKFVVRVPEEQLSLQDFYDEIEKIPSSPDLIARFWVEAIDDKQIKLVFSYAVKETKPLDINLSGSYSIAESVVRQSNNKISIAGSLTSSSQVVAIYLLQE